MKNLLLIVLIVLKFSACREIRKGKTYKIDETEVLNTISEFKIVKDTFDFSINGILRDVSYFNNKYYCMFRTNRDSISEDVKEMIVLGENGAFIENIFVPSEIQKMLYYEIKIENDSLFLQNTEQDEENFVLGKYVTDFQRTKTRVFKIYEDKQFKIYSICDGEFGGTIFFQDKITNELFEGSSTCPIVVNKIGTDYYITNHLSHLGEHISVNKISDPRKLEKSDWNFKKRFGSINKKGIETMLDTFNLYSSTSFVVNNRLAHIYNDYKYKETYIAEIENGKIIPIYTFDFMFYSHFNQQLENGKQLLTFRNVENEKNGILIIEGNELTFHYFK